ncbi:LOW QUALITY PROTEIN: Reverse transcriptase [Phytophthora palmivora]|uniref:Reverse transcriptase n=1 Tax=Phytophthora palmivora TaxID=4796 RepID=A0A2P4Y0Q7_9STRA|nr:LOW QUALITY PROTEIN: Reverse transcriptase [Phytophthora palmivora]
MERNRRAQDEEKWIVDLKVYLREDVLDLTSAEVKSCSKIADRYETDNSPLLFYFPPTKQSDEDRDHVAKLIVPETLQSDLMHHYHASLEGGHQGIERTYHKIRAHLHWRGLYQSVQRYVGQCIDCETGTGRPTIHRESLVISKQRTRSRLSVWITYRRYQDRNIELLIWIDLFTGYVIAKASASRTTQTVAENYEECVFRQFGASEAIRHDREPGFMSDFFRSFNKIVGQRQRATMAYRPQANGTTERMVGTLTRAVKMYVEDIDQRDWDEYAGRLTFELNTVQDRVRGDAPFYLLHGWEPRSTLEPMIPLGSTRRRDCEPRRWRYRIQKQYQQARGQVNERLHRHNETVRPHEIEVGTQAWLYLDRVKEGYARKLAHMWHVDEHTVRLEIAGTEYRLFPVVHVSKIKPARQFPDRPHMRLTIQDQDRYDFDKALLPEDSWTQDLDIDEYEVEKITCDPGSVGDIDVHYVNSWCTGKDMTNRRGWMRSILIVELYGMTIFEIERIEIDSRSCN